MFETSGKSDFGRTLENLEDNVRGREHIMEGMLLNEQYSKKELDAWMRCLHL